MAVIKATAYLNELTKDVTNDYYLQHQPLGTLYEDDIIRRLERKEIATKNVNGKAFVQTFFSECLLALGEGYNVVTPLFQASLSIKGTILSSELGRNVPADRADVRINMVQGSEARSSVKSLTVSVNEQPAPTGPVIQSVTNPVENEADVLNTGAMALVQGLRLAVRGDKTEEIGVYFISADGATTVRVPAEHISPNTPSRLQFVLPAAVTPGEWTVKVATQATSTSNSFTKEVREYLYPAIVTVV